MTVTESTLDAIKTDLVLGIREHNRRRNRYRMAVAVPVLGLIAAAGIVLANATDNPAYALTEQSDGTIRVQVFPEFDDVDALQSELEDAGLQVAVIQLRAAPSLEGVVEVSSSDNVASGALEFQGGEFVIDVGAVQSEIEILIYSPTDSGDDYGVSPSVFAPGQQFQGLHCAYPDAPLTSADFEARARAAGVSNIKWMSLGDIDPDTGSATAREYDERPGGVVISAQMTNPDTMQVVVDLESQEPAASTIGMNDGTHYRPVPTCTPELAALWE